MKKCNRCGAEKPLDEFSWKNKAQGTRSRECKKCHSLYNKAHYQNNKEVYQTRNRQRSDEMRDIGYANVEAYLTCHPCVDCGESNPVVLEFDHQRDKKFAIGTMIKNGYGWADIMKEIEKCEIRCANCHRKKTAKQMGWRRMHFGETQPNA